MTKEEAAAMLGGKPVAPDSPEKVNVQRECHEYVMDKKTTQKFSNAVFQDDEQAVFADTVAQFGNIDTGDIDPKVRASFAQAVGLTKVLFPMDMMIFHQGICFTREGYVVATIEVSPRGISLGLMQKSLHPFDGGYADEKVVLLAKETAKEFEEAASKNTGLILQQSPEEVASAIIAAIGKLPKED